MFYVLTCTYVYVKVSMFIDMCVDVLYEHVFMCGYSCACVCAQELCVSVHTCEGIHMFVFRLEVL